MAHGPCLPRAVEPKPCIISDTRSRHLRGTGPLPRGQHGGRAGHFSLPAPGSARAHSLSAARQGWEAGSRSPARLMLDTQQCYLKGHGAVGQPGPAPAVSHPRCSRPRLCPPSSEPESSLPPSHPPPRSLLWALKQHRCPGGEGSGRPARGWETPPAQTTSASRWARQPWRRPCSLQFRMVGSAPLHVVCWPRPPASRREAGSAGPRRLCKPPCTWCTTWPCFFIFCFFFVFCFCFYPVCHLIRLLSSFTLSAIL